MSKPLCRLCPKPAHFNFREGILLCAECAADILKLCEISNSPGPSCVAGMPHDLANAGGDHDQRLTSSFLRSALDESATALEQASLTAERAVDERWHTGVAPGACGPEREIFGAPNSISPIEQPQPNPDQQSQDQAKHEASVYPGVVEAHDGIPEMFRRAMP